MGVPMISVLPLIAVIIAILTQISYAQNTPHDYLNAHNIARSQVGVGPMKWDATVASYAQNYVNTLGGNCKMVHSHGPYGENLAWYSADLTGTAAVDMWVAEKPHYDYNSNSCVGAKCKHYTQVVWRNDEQCRVATKS